jgi:hypothetical protein
MNVAASMEREAREMDEHILDLQADTGNVDLSHFELVTEVSEEAWEKLRKLTLLTTLKLPLSLQWIPERDLYLNFAQLWQNV